MLRSQASDQLPARTTSEHREPDGLAILALSRHPDRLRASDVCAGIFPEGIRMDSPDPALVIWRAQWSGREILILGQDKAKTRGYAEGQQVNFGMMRPEGYLHVMRLLTEAEERGWLLITLIDTPGADPSEHSARYLQSWRISECISRFCSARTPTLSVILGEGGSGGALALQATDLRYMMEYAIFSVISPESCGAILFRDNRKMQESMDLLQPTARNMLQLGIIDAIVPEPAGGARRGDPTSLKLLRAELERGMAELFEFELDTLLKRRYDRLRHLGAFEASANSLQVLRAGALKRNLNRLKTSQQIDLSELATNDATGGIAYSYVLERLKESSLQDTEVVLCKPSAGGCNTYLDAAEYLANFKSCPKCGLGEALDADEWAACLLDDGILYEMDRHLTIADLRGGGSPSADYHDTLARAQRSSGHIEALVTGRGAVSGMPVVVALSCFSFIGGSMGTVVGEKFARAAEYALEHRLPLISLCCSGGARMQEGTLSLVQMAKVNAVLNQLVASKGLYLSILANPTTGGSLASYATRGAILVCEPQALVSFAGPRVTELAGIPVPSYVMKPEFLLRQGGVHEICARRDMARSLTKYVFLYYQCR